MLRLILILACVLTGCTTVPQSFVPTLPIRVVSFSLSSTVTEGPGGKPEQLPGASALFGSAFENALEDSVAGLWASFVDSAPRRWPGVSVLPPGDEAEHPGYVEAGFEPLGRYSFAFPPPRARGYVWPKGFRFVDAEPDRIRTLAPDYPGDLFLIVEHRGFIEGAEDETAFGPGRFKMGLFSYFMVYDAAGTLLSKVTLHGISATSAARLGKRPDRAQYARLLVEAQEDVLAQWDKLSRRETSAR